MLPDHDRDLNTHRCDLRNLFDNAINRFAIDAVWVIAHQGLTRKFEQDTFGRCSHIDSFLEGGGNLRAR